MSYSVSSVKRPRTSAGAPTAALLAPKGALCTDTTNGKLYINTGTATVPVWTVVGSQVV